MKIEPFQLERLQSEWEHVVEINLSESGIEPMTPRELLGDDQRLCEELLDQELMYVQTNGTPQLRQRIADLYDDATPEHVLVTTGGAEANFLSILKLVEPGDEVVMMTPNYMQTFGISSGFGATVHRWPLLADRTLGRWHPDLEQLDALVSDKTRLILVCTPNNPTGAALEHEELEHICTVASRVGAWVLSDEIYRGVELDGGSSPEPSASIWGRYERTITTNGLSKAYALPGLRIGWVVAPPDLIDSLWSYHDYTTIAPSALSDRLATVALEPARRRQILERNRAILARNYDVVSGWLSQHERLQHIPPRAGAMLFLAYDHPVNSSELCDRLRQEENVLVVPGDHYGMDGYLRLGFGGHTEQLEEGLARVSRQLDSLAVGV